MMNFKVDIEKCTQCKICVSECPVLIINGKTEWPTIKEGKEDNCLKCQHCLAVCPTGAISIWGYNPENSIPATVPTPKRSDLENLMQTRRSIRRFKKEEVDKALIERLLTIASYAPTAKNENAVQFTVVDNKEEMSQLRALTYDTIKEISAAGNMPASMAFLSNFQNVWESKKIDVIFRGAPHVLIASAPVKSTAPDLDATLAMTYFDLLANTEVIGTLWDGFAKNVFEDVDSDLKSKMGIPNDHRIVSVLVFGFPAVKFPRSIQNTPHIKSVKL